MQRRLGRWLLGLILGLGGVGLLLPYLIPLPGPHGQDPAAVAPAGGFFITAGGVRTWVERSGPADAPTVVLVHGFGGSTFSWRETLPALAAAGYDAVALDLKGFGLADKRLQADYSHAAQADFIAQVMTELDIEQAVIVGHSMGGSVAAHFALRHPQRTLGVVFVDGGAFQQAGEGRSSGLADLLAWGPLQRWGRLALRLTLTPERIISRLRTAYADPDFVTAEVAAGYLRAQQTTEWDLGLLGILRDGNKNGLPAQLETITAPTLVVWGEADRWIRLSAGRRLHAQLPGADFIVIPNAGHMPMEETAPAFNAALLPFISMVTTP